MTDIDLLRTELQRWRDECTEAQAALELIQHTVISENLAQNEETFLNLANVIRVAAERLEQTTTAMKVYSYLVTHVPT